MGAKSDPSDVEVQFDELEPVDDDAADDGDWIDHEPGETITGVITDFDPFAGYNGVVEINGRPYSLNESMTRDIASALATGAKIGISKSESQESFDNDGETVEYYPREVRASHGGDN